MDKRILNLYHEISQKHGLSFYLYKITKQDILTYKEHTSYYLDISDILEKESVVQDFEFEEFPVDLNDENLITQDVDISIPHHLQEMFLVETLWAGEYEEFIKIVNTPWYRFDISRILSYKNDKYKDGFNTESLMSYSENKNFRHVIENLTEVSLLHYFNKLENIDNYFSIVKTFNNNRYISFTKCLIDRNFIEKITYKDSRNLFYNHLFELFSYSENIPYISQLPELKKLDDNRKLNNLFYQEKENNVFELTLKLSDFNSYFLIKQKNVRYDFIRKSVYSICQSIQSNINLFENLNRIDFVEITSEFIIYVNTKKDINNFDTKLLNFIVSSVYDVVLTSKIVHDDNSMDSSNKTLFIDKDFIDKLVEMFAISFNLDKKNDLNIKKNKI